MSLEVLHGSCLCGAMQDEVRKPYLRFAHCYSRFALLTIHYEPNSGARAARDE